MTRNADRHTAAKDTVITFSVYGKKMYVERSANRWLLFADSLTGVRLMVTDIVIPPDMKEGDLAGYLADVYHENATERCSSVARLDGPAPSK